MDTWEARCPPPKKSPFRFSYVELGPALQTPYNGAQVFLGRGCWGREGDKAEDSGEGKGQLAGRKESNKRGRPSGKRKRKYIPITFLLCLSVFTLLLYKYFILNVFNIDICHFEDPI